MYVLLVALYDKCNTERLRSRILGELRPLLTREHENERDRRNHIYKLMCELQTRKRLQCLKLPKVCVNAAGSNHQAAGPTMGCHIQAT